MIDLADEGFTANDFEPVGVFGSRGIGPEAVKGAFYRYEQEADVRPETVFNGPSDDMNDVIGRALRRARRLAKKARGMMMVRFPVPDANPFIFNEQRPDWAIWVGDPTYPAWMGGIPDPHDHDNDFTDASISLKRHVNRGKTNVEHVERGVTPDE